MRQRLAWLSTVPLMLGGLLSGHWLGYRLAIPDAHARADELAHSGHGYLGHAPLALTTGVLVLIAALVLRTLAGFRGQPRRPAASPVIVLLSPVAFVVQEHVERLVHSGEMPWTAALQPSFLVGLALQLPFALAALLLTWALDSVAHAVGRALTAVPPHQHPLVPVFGPLPASVTAAPRPAGLARGYGERAPPLLRRP
jgi:hypothetical protein